MKLCELSEEQVVPSIVLRSMASDMIGIITSVLTEKEDRMPSAVILWLNGEESWVFLHQAENEIVFMPPRVGSILR